MGDPSSWCLGLGGGIKDNFLEEGLSMPISEHRKGLHGIKGKEGVHVCITQDQVLNPYPHIRLCLCPVLPSGPMSRK